MKERLKIKILNREICVCALLATNSFMRKKQRRNGDNYESRERSGMIYYEGIDKGYGETGNDSGKCGGAGDRQK